MTTFSPTPRTTSSNAQRTIIGSACIVAAVAVVGMISMISSAQPGGAQFATTAAMDADNQSQLSGLLCRIDRRCPAMVLTQAGREAKSAGRGPGRRDQ
jgi:hypothetical protein